MIMFLKFRMKIGFYVSITKSLNCLSFRKDEKLKIPKWHINRHSVLF